MKLKDVLCQQCKRPWPEHKNQPHSFAPPDGWIVDLKGRLWDMRYNIEQQKTANPDMPGWFFGMTADRAREFGYDLPDFLPGHYVLHEDKSSPTGRRWVDPRPDPEWCLAV